VIKLPVTVHGIKACDTMKKARFWLEAHGVAHDFHDYKTQGIDEATLRGWVAQLGWEPLLNRSGTTFRKLPEAERQNLAAAKAIRLMLAQPSMIERPVLAVNGTRLVGFKPETYAARFSA
jgi:arsenate reductase